MTDGLLAVFQLKALLRSGWVRRGVPQPESVAAHSWGVSLLVLALLPPHLDLKKALAYAVLHDLPEVSVGDLTPADGVAAPEKHRREALAMRDLASAVPNGAQLLALWQAYEAGEDEESRFVRQLDRLDMALQAVAYHRATGLDLAEFLRAADPVLVSPELRLLFEPLRAERSEG